MNLGPPQEQLFEQGNILNQLKVDQALRLAKKKANAGQVNDAKKIYSDILEKFPKNKKALKALKAPKVGLTPKKSLSNDPPSSVLLPIVELFNSGKHQQALETSIELLSAFPNSALLHNFCGAANAELGHYDIALIGYKNAISLQPHLTDAYYNMGVAESALGQLSEAKTAYKSALKMDARNSNAWNNLGIIYKDQGFSEKALNSFDKAIAFNQNHLQAYFNKANLLRDIGRTKEAINFFNKVIKVNPKYFEAYSSLGALFRKQGEVERAIENYKKALDINPNYPEAHFLLGNAKQDLLEYDEALDHYRNAIDLKIDYAQAYAGMGDIYRDKDYIQEAVGSYQLAIDFDPNCVETVANLAYAHQFNGELEIAIKTFQRALEMDPERAETYSNFAMALTDNQQKKEAFEAHEIAIKKEPETPTILLNYGSSLDRYGEMNKALEIYKKALKIEPNYESAHTSIAFILFFKGELERAVEHRKWRWTTKEGQQKISHLKLPEWDGKQSLKGKRVLALGEQGPGDIIMWSPGLEYLKSLGGRVTLQCHAKLTELFKMSFTDIEIKPYDSKKTLGTEDFDYYIPMETLFGYFCISEQKRDKTLNFSAPAQLKTDAFLFPKQERINFWKDRLNKIGKGPFVGISWKSPKVTYSRKRNYTELSDWEPLLSLPNITFINLQSTNFQDDLLEIKKKYSVHVHNFDDLDHYDDFADVAALCAALDVCVSVSTAVSTVAGAVGTPTHMLHWRRSSWNNVLFTPPGPKVKIYEKDTWEPWANCFESIAKDMKK